MLQPLNLVSSVFLGEARFAVADATPEAVPLDTSLFDRPVQHVQQYTHICWYWHPFPTGCVHLHQFHFCVFCSDIGSHSCSSMHSCCHTCDHKSIDAGGDHHLSFSAD
ncbi:TPA: hypothetical protein ACH3X2_009234 [Trebouxia sp. C0005]